MKNVIMTLVCMSLFCDLSAQNIVYGSSGSKVAYIKDDLDIIFSDADQSSVFFPKKEGKEESATLLTMLPTVVDLGFKLATNVLENRQKKFTAEYAVHKSYLDAGKSVMKNGNRNAVPDITIVRSVNIEKDKAALLIKFKAKQFEGINSFYFYVSEIELNYSKARSTRKNSTFDYTIELKPILIISGKEGLKKEEQQLAPLVLSSIDFGKKTFEESKFRTGMIPLSHDAMFGEVAVKIVETNKAKVNADKILEIFNAYKDDAKTIINNILPKQGEGIDNKSMTPQKEAGNEPK